MSRASRPRRLLGGEPVVAHRFRRFGLLQLIGARFVVRLGALDQRIALDLLFDEALQFGIGHLQQLDRLHQLRRHHQRLRLS
jgi:hypothetical protein